jgi:hypothetical protein
VLASDLLLGHDEYAMQWISNFRAEQKKLAARDSAAGVAKRP